MKALSVKQPWAGLIAAGRKTIETRTWLTNYRGDLLICAGVSRSRSDESRAVEPAPDERFGVALCVVRLVECRPMTPADETAACCKIYPRAWAWVIEDVRPIEPVPVRGRLQLFDVDMAIGIPNRRAATGLGGPT